MMARVSRESLALAVPGLCLPLTSLAVHAAHTTMPGATKRPASSRHSGPPTPWRVPRPSPWLHNAAAHALFHSPVAPPHTRTCMLSTPLQHRMSVFFSAMRSRMNMLKRYSSKAPEAWMSTASTPARSMLPFGASFFATRCAPRSPCRGAQVKVRPSIGG